MCGKHIASMAMSVVLEVSDNKLRAYKKKGEYILGF